MPERKSSILSADGYINVASKPNENDFFMKLYEPYPRGKWYIYALSVEYKISKSENIFQIKQTVLILNLLDKLLSYLFF